MAAIVNTDPNFEEIPESILDMDFELDLFHDRLEIGKEVFNRALAKEKLARAAGRGTGAVF